MACAASFATLVILIIATPPLGLFHVRLGFGIFAAVLTATFTWLLWSKVSDHKLNPKARVPSSRSIARSPRVKVGRYLANLRRSDVLTQYLTVAFVGNPIAVLVAFHG